VGRTFAVIGAIVIIIGGGAIGYAVTRKGAGGMSAGQTAAMARAVGQLDGDIKAARTAVAARARTLSAPAVVRGAIVTNTATIEDLVTHGDVVPEAGEILELGRIDKKTSSVEQLLVVPKGARAAMGVSHGGKADSYVELVGDQIVITEVVNVVPTQQADEYMGFLGVTRPLELAPAIKSLADAGITGKLVIDQRELAIGVMPAGATTREQPLSSQSGAKIIAAEPPPHAVMPVPVLVGGIGAAVIGLLLVVISIMGKRDAAYSRAFAAMPRAPSSPPPETRPDTGIGSAQTQLSQHNVVAAGTPSPLDPASAGQIVPTNLGPGAMIGRWEVVRRLGSGGMADVYLAQAKGDGGFEKLVAIKVMHGHLARTQRAVDHFLDEARLAARIHHPNVVAIQDLGKIGSDYVIVMEYVDGVDLERLLTSARQGERLVPVAVGLAILCRICDGLDAAHRATAPDGSPLGIVHRDVKSANVLVSRQGIVKVVDFGIAKAATQVHQTIAGETKGTPSMMAPEQRVGEKVDVRADVYSAAAVGYEIVTGHGVNLDLAALAHLGIENWPHLPLPSSLRAELPPELDNVLLHAMAFERDRRPADCAVFEEQCEAVMKRHQLTTSDKEIARWVESELRHLGPAFAGESMSLVKSPPV
jgi:serine/threonine-protein kinase